MLDELQQHRVGPVDILYHHDQRTVAGHCFQKEPPGGERLLLAAGLAAGAGGAGKPDQRPEPGLQPRPGLIRCGHRVDGGGQLLTGLSPVVRFEDSRLSLDHLAQSPETGPLPVGQATALPPAHQIGLPGDPGMKFAHQPGLAHPRFTGNSDQLNTRLPGGPVKRTLQSDELSLTANKGSGRWQDFGRRPGPDTDSFPQLQGFAFPPDHGRRRARGPRRTSCCGRCHCPDTGRGPSVRKHLRQC